MDVFTPANNELGGLDLYFQDFTVSTVYPQPISAQVDSELEVQGAPIIRFLVVEKNRLNLPVDVSLIRGGKVIQEFSGNTPLEVQYADLGFQFFEKSYYRLVARCDHSRIISHPIFVRKGEDVEAIAD
jgi:hypothetical protein